MSLTLITPPTDEPVTLEEAKEHLRLLGQEEESYVDSLLRAARQWCEGYARQTLLTSVWRETFGCWPSNGCLALSRPPLRTVGSVTYVDTDGATQTLAVSEYVVDTQSFPGRLLRGYGKTWPTLRTDGVPHPITVEFTAGYATPADIPECFKHAIKLIVGSWFEQREDSMPAAQRPIPHGARALLAAVGHGEYP